jgi:hypothetical protein
MPKLSRQLAVPLRSIWDWHPNSDKDNIEATNFNAFEMVSAALPYWSNKNLHFCRREHQTSSIANNLGSLDNLIIPTG